MVSSSPTATRMNFPSLLNSMPRGLWPTLIVFMTASLSISITLIVLLFSFETYARNALVGACMRTSSAIPSRQARQIIGITVSTSVGLAFGFRPVDAQRIQFRYLMQKPFLRRDRDHHSAVGQKDGLPKLQIPVPDCQSLPLECRNSEIGALDKIQQDPRYRRTRSR